MAENSKIEWTHHTLNPWRGCTKISPGCANCYAETMSKRNPSVLGKWGPNGQRVVAAESAWQEPLKWDRKAKAAGERHRVFCASLADVFEDWRGPMIASNGSACYWCENCKEKTAGPTPETCLCGAGLRPATMDHIRIRLFRLIQATPSLDWLLLTKRPENALEMMVRAGLYMVANPSLPCPQRNLWIGTSVENQEQADLRIPHLLATSAAVRFLSVEPLLGPVNLWSRMGACVWSGKGQETASGIDWVIVGGESGHDARPMHPDWARKIRDDCQAAGVPFFFKQWGEWYPCAFERENWPESHGRFTFAEDGRQMVRYGKKGSGRMLDGREWSEFPEARATQ